MTSDTSRSVLNTDNEVEPSSYFVLIALGQQNTQSNTQQLLFLHSLHRLPPAGIFFAAGIIYVVSLPFRALWKALPQKKHAKTPKRPASLPDDSAL